MDVPDGKVEGRSADERDRAKKVNLEGWEECVGGVQSAQTKKSETPHSC